MASWASLRAPTPQGETTDEPIMVSIENDSSPPTSPGPDDPPRRYRCPTCDFLLPVGLLPHSEPPDRVPSPLRRAAFGPPSSADPPSSGADPTDDDAPRNDDDADAHMSEAAAVHDGTATDNDEDDNADDAAGMTLSNRVLCLETSLDAVHDAQVRLRDRVTAADHRQDRATARLGARADTLAANLHTAQRELQISRGQLAALRAELRQMRRSLAAVPAPAHAYTPPFPDPEIFRGDAIAEDPGAYRVRDFAFALRWKLVRNGDHFPAEADRVGYAVARTAGPARRVLDPHLTADGGLRLPSVEALLAILGLHFG